MSATGTVAYPLQQRGGLHNTRRPKNEKSAATSASGAPKRHPRKRVLAARDTVRSRYERSHNQSWRNTPPVHAMFATDLSPNNAILNANVLPARKTRSSTTYVHKILLAVPKKLHKNIKTGVLPSVRPTQQNQKQKQKQTKQHPI